MSVHALTTDQDLAAVFGPTETDRAAWALAAVKTYAAWTRHTPESQLIEGRNAETVIVDFLADLHRIVDVLDLDADFEQLSERGRRRYAGPAADHANPSRRRDLQPGTRVWLINCADRHAYVQPGTRGTASFVDDAGTVHINWDGGGTLGLRPNADRYEITGQTRLATAREGHPG